MEEGHFGVSGVNDERRLDHGVGVGRNISNSLIYLAVYPHIISIVSIASSPHVAIQVLIVDFRGIVCFTFVESSRSPFSPSRQGLMLILACGKLFKNILLHVVGWI